MFIATALAYPCALALLCTGAGLLVDRLAGGAVATALMVTVGAAALIAVSQLATYVHAIAPATPYLLAAAALSGLWLGRARARVLLADARGHALELAVPVLAYAIAIAPVLAAGRPTFTSFMALSDSAVHLIGADYLINHGQHYAQLDLHNSYGRFIDAYYNSGYPSGADTLFGGSALLLRLPLTWAFQPFNAFLLASATGPAWLLVRRLGLRGAWAAAASLSVVLPAIVYAYELLGSVKEIAALAMILTLGALVADHRRWLAGSPTRAIPFALVVAAGVSVLGVGFGAWALAAAVVLAVIVLGELRAGRRTAGGVAVLAVLAIAALAVAALPTWARVSGSLRVASNIASTSNPGNLHNPLSTGQVLGVWLRGSYKLSPSGAALVLTRILMAVTLVAAVLGAVEAVRRRAFAPAAWAALMLLAWVVVTRSTTTWANAKALMITSPVVVLLAWWGVAALRGDAGARGVARGRGSPRRLGAVLAAVLAVALLGGALASDALQYRATNLAPTRRYDELASIDSRFAGRGPALVTDFDEYAMYVLRHLNVGGPDFVYPPPALAGLAGGYGERVDLERAPPSALAAYPLLVTRREPDLPRPPAAYALRWRGAYYEVWERRPRVAAALVHVSLDGTRAAQCARLGALARAAPSAGARLYAAQPPLIVRVALAATTHPRRWGRQREALVMSSAGRLDAGFRLPAGGRWWLWLQGELMPKVTVAVDGRRLASVSGELSGNSLVPDTLPPIAVELAAGRHRLTLDRGAAGLRPGGAGAAVLEGIMLTPAGAGPALASAPARAWRTLCGHRYSWAELVG